MNKSPVELGPGRLRAIQRAACAVAGGLSRLHGQRQFYPIAHVQSQARSAAVDSALLAWIYALFVKSEDFEAFFAVRETPGTYAQLRAALSAAEAPRVHERGQDDDVIDELWQLLSAVVDL